MKKATCVNDTQVVMYYLSVPIYLIISYHIFLLIYSLGNTQITTKYIDQIVFWKDAVALSEMRDIFDDLTEFSVNKSNEMLLRETVTGYTAHQKDLDFSHCNGFYLGNANTSYDRKFFNNVH